MNLYVTVVSGVAVFLCIMILNAAEWQRFDPAVAKLALSEQLISAADLEAGAQLTIHPGTCAEAQGNTGTISGRAVATAEEQSADGVPLRSVAEFSYRAKVTNTCESHNPNCYSIDTVDVEGTTAVMPEL